MSKAKPEIPEDKARELLERERKRRESALADYERVHESEVEEADTATAPEDDAEVIGDEQVDDALARQMREELEAIERAAERLKDGTYGLSVESGEPIPAKRLETIPWAERTAEEQQRHERGGG